MLADDHRRLCEKALSSCFSVRNIANIARILEVGARNVDEGKAKECPFIIRQECNVLKERAILNFSNLVSELGDLQILTEHKHRWNPERQKTTARSFLLNIDETEFYWRQVELGRLGIKKPELPGGLVIRSDTIYFDYLWIGPTGTIQTFHQDNHDETITNHNLFMQFEGFKYVAVASPSDSDFFRSRPLTTKSLRHSSASPFDALVREACSTLAHAVLGPGDALYVPPRFWHYFQSLSPSISVSRWWFSNRIAETLYAAENEFPVASPNAPLGSKEWQEDLAAFGGKKVFETIFSRLQPLKKYGMMVVLIRRYGEGALSHGGSIVMWL